MSIFKDMDTMEDVDLAESELKAIQNVLIMHEQNTLESLEDFEDIPIDIIRF
jgi:hypothetical protein